MQLLERIGQVTTGPWEQWTQPLSIAKLQATENSSISINSIRIHSIRIPERQWLLVTIKEWTDDEMVLSTDHRAAGANVLAFVPPPCGL